MRRISTLFAASIASCCTLLAQNTEGVKINGLYYIFDTEKQTASVKNVPIQDNGYEYTGNITVPKNVTHELVEYTVTEISADAFYQTNITSVTLPNSIVTIQDHAFKECKQLTAVTLGNGLTTIKTSAFESCTALTQITLPASITEMWGAAFARCTSLQTVICNMATPTDYDHTFDYYDNNEGWTPIDCKIYVPAASHNAYKNAYGTKEGWKYHNIVSYIPEVNVSFNKEAIGFYIGNTEGTVQTNIRSNISCTNNDQYSITASSCALAYANGTTPTAINENDKIEDSKTYLAGIALSSKDGFEWPADKSKLALKINNEAATIEHYIVDGNNATMYVALGTPAAATAVSGVAANAISVEQGKVTCSEPFRIYALSGADVTSQNGNLKGIYIVKTATAVQKVSL